MTTRITPYCQIWGRDYTELMFSDGLTPSGGELGVEEMAIPGRGYGDARAKGRLPKKYRVRVGSDDREKIELFLAEVNTAPEDAEFYPFDADRHGLIASAYAVAMPELKAYNWYEAEAIITCREPWLYDADQGIDLTQLQALPAVSAAFTNNGQERAPLTYLQASGDYVSGAYVQGLSCRITPGSSTTEMDRKLTLCDKMLRADNFELNWRGDVAHSWETDFSKPWVDISADLHGKTSGGALSGQTLILDNGDYMMIPLYGPLPITGDTGASQLDFTLAAIGGTGGAVQVAYQTNLSDMAEVEQELVVGRNTVYIPDCEGKGHIAMGIKADVGVSNSLTLSEISAFTRRYVAPNKIPWIDAEESVKIRVESTAGTRLNFLQACFNGRYYY